MNVPQDLRYTKTHEWAKTDGELIVVGITDFAQHQLSDITFVELPAVGKKLEADGAAAVVESVKAASDVYAPVAGTVAEANAALSATPELINSDPYGAGWLFKMKPDRAGDASRLLAAADYEKLLPASGD